MTTFNVSSSTQLVSTLAAAHSGDTIMLASGNYSGFYINNVNFASNVTIESASSTNQAVLGGFQINNSSGITLKNVEMNVTGALNPYYGYEINNSSSITLDTVSMHGSMNNDPADDITGLLIRGSNNVSVLNSEFQQLSDGISQVDNTNLLIHGNSFHDIRTDGIDGGGSSYVNISNNSFTNFYTSSTTQHPDAIQFWTTATTASAHDISITGNTISVGSGDQAQGIFMTDQVGNLPYENVTIANNTVTGEMYNGIYVQHADNLTLSGNTVTAATASTAANMGSALGAIVDAAVATQITTSWIGLANTSNATLSGNNATTYNLTGNTDLSIGGDNAVSGTVQSASVTATGSYVMGPLTTMVTLTGNGYASAAGNALDDTIIANDAGDRLVAGSGKDVLIGGAGNDILVAGSGLDTMTGGLGKNTFTFTKTAGGATITDFWSGSHDVLDLSAMIAAGLHPVLQAVGSDTQITFSGSNAAITLLGVHPDALVATASGYTI